MIIGSNDFDFNNPYIMGILNITPDSFFDGGNYNQIDISLKHVEKMINEGVDIIDIGGESTKPGSDFVSENEELKRVIPVIENIVKYFPNIPLSIDTTKSKVMEESIIRGVSLVNDISGLLFDENSVAIIKKYDIPVVIMHSPWKPKTMQNDYKYTKPIMNHLIDYFNERKSFLKNNNIHNIIIDPGIGFGKSIEHNFEIIKKLNELTILDLPILIGASNKSFIGKTLNVDLSLRKEGNTLTEAISFKNGARLFRVHDVASTKRTLKLAKYFF